MPRPPLAPGEYGDPWTRSLSATEHVGFIYVRDPAGRRRRLERRAATAPAARRAVTAAARAVAGGLTGTGGLDGDTRFADAARQWLTEREQHGAAPSSMDHYRKRLAVILPVLGQARLSEITPRTLKDMFEQLAPGRTVSTLRAYRSAISGVLAMAVENDAIPTNVASGALRGQRHKPKMPRALNPVERRELPAALEADEHAPTWLPELVRLMLMTGVRIGEALALRWCDVELDGAPPSVEVSGTLVHAGGRTFRTEGGKTNAAARTIPMPPPLVRSLRERMATDSQWPDRSAWSVWCDTARPLFPGTEPPGRPGEGPWLPLPVVHRELRRALDRAGYDWVTSHVFRKTAATMMDEQGLAVRAIADFLGHSNPSLTQDVYFGRQLTTEATAAALDEVWRDDE